MEALSEESVLGTSSEASDALQAQDDGGLR